MITILGQTGTGTATNVVTPTETGAVHYVYVRSTGSDATGNGSLAAPYATLRYALDQIPLVIRGCRYVVDVTGITEVVAEPIYVPAFVGSPGGVIDASQAGFDTLQYTLTIRAQPTVLYTITAPVVTHDAVTNLTSVQSVGAAWGVNAWKGQFLMGASIYEWFPIVSNTADTLTLAGTYNCTPPGHIVSLGAEIRYDNPGLSSAHHPDPATAALVVSGVSCSVCLQGLKLSTAEPDWSNGGGLYAANAPLLEVDVVELQGYYEGTGLSFRHMFAVYSPTLGGTDFRFWWFSGDNDGSIEHVFLDKAYVYCFALRIQGGYITDTILQQIARYGRSTGNSWINSLKATGGGTLYFESGTIMCDRSTISHTSSGIDIAGPGTYLRLYIVTGTNGSYGVTSNNGAHVRFATGSTTITGGTNSLKTGTLAARAWAGLTNEFDPATGCRTSNGA